MAYVCQKKLEALQEKLEKGEEVPTLEELNRLVSDLDDLPETDIVVPVDSAVLGEDFDEIGPEGLVKKHGLKRAAELFVKAAKLYSEKPEGEGDDEKMKPITVKEMLEQMRMMEDLSDEDSESDEEEDEEDEEDEEEDGNLTYGCQKTLEALQEKLNKGQEEPTLEELKKLVNNLDDLPDTEIVVPMDDSVLGEDFVQIGVAGLVAKHGLKGTAELFVKAAKVYSEKKEGEGDDKNLKPITAKEMKELMMELAEDDSDDENASDDADDSDEEEDEEDGDEEGEEDEEDEEDGAEDDDAGGDEDEEIKEPSSKKAKTAA